MNDLDARISAALHAAADQVRLDDLRLAAPPTATSTGARRRPWIAVTLAAAVVAGVAIGVSALAGGQTTAAHHVQPGRPGPSLTKTSPAPSGPVSSDKIALKRERAARAAAEQERLAHERAQRVAARQRALASGCYFADACTGVGLPAGHFYYEPLWPFASYQQAHEWQAHGNGSQRWHLDAGQTALLFARQFLGFTDITKVTSTKLDSDGAHIGVGYDQPGGAPHTAAVIHLLRYVKGGVDKGAGWEVVGSDDTDFSLTTPAYGATVASTIAVGGSITGVDERIVVLARNQAGAIVGHAPGVAAGGTDQPWHTKMGVAGSGVLTVVAYTGGHNAEHERFAIQGVHT